MRPRLHQGRRPSRRPDRSPARLRTTSLPGRRSITSRRRSSAAYSARCRYFSTSRTRGWPSSPVAAIKASRNLPRCPARGGDEETLRHLRRPAHFTIRRVGSEVRRPCCSVQEVGLREGGLQPLHRYRHREKAHRGWCWHCPGHRAPRPKDKAYLGNGDTIVFAMNDVIEPFGSSPAVATSAPGPGQCTAWH